jgi:hypothetical protein
MKPEPQRTEKYFGNDFKMLTQLPVETRGLELLREQALRASGQEITDLYQMLRDKCRQDAPRLSGSRLH